MKGRRVEVRDGNVEKALRKFKKKVANSGVLIEVKKRQEFTKPSVEKKLQRSAARKRWMKYLAQQHPGPGR